MNASYSTSSYYDTSGLTRSNKDYKFSITSNYGYFIKDNIAIGVNLNFSTATTHIDLIDPPDPSYYNNATDLIYGGGAFIRYYKKIIGNLNLTFTGKLGYNYEDLKNNYVSTTSNTEYKTEIYNAAIIPGLVYFISPKFGIETTFGNLSYTYTNYKDNLSTSGTHSSNGDLQLNFTFSTFQFGLSYYF